MSDEQYEQQIWAEFMIPQRGDEFALEREALLLFRQECIITVKNDLIDPKGFNFEQVPGKTYRTFKPLFRAEENKLSDLLELWWVMLLHMLAVRRESPDYVGEEYLFIRAYRVGHTLEDETIAAVVEAQVKGGCYLIDGDGHIAGDGKGRWYGVLCPAEAEAELIADLRAQEAERRKLIPKQLYRWGNPDEVDTSEIG